VDIPSSKLKIGIAGLLKSEGYIRDFKVVKDGPQGTLKVYLKYMPDRQRAINGLKRISKPGLRAYVNKDEIPRVLGGLGVAILSTSRGILTDKQSRKENVGGEVLCYVW
jgi:small subunit ribosomal protein S8